MGVFPPRQFSIGAAMLCVAAALSAWGDGPPKGPAVVLSSFHQVYRPGEPIDLTYWVRSPDAALSLSARVLDEAGAALPARAEADLGGPVERGGSLVGKVADLRDSWATDRPGRYSILLIGAAPNGRRVVISAPMPIRVDAECRPQPIPLDQIAASNMPGTRPLEGLAAERAFAALSLSEAGAPRPTVFFVSGRGDMALDEAAAVLGGKAPARVLPPAEGPVSVVFASRPFGAYVHLTGCERRGNTLELRYAVVPHRTREMTAHLALISLEDLIPRTLQIAVRPQPTPETAALDWVEVTTRIVRVPAPHNMD